MNKRIRIPLKFVGYLLVGILAALVAFLICMPWEIYKWCRGFPKALEDAYLAFEEAENQMYPD